MKALRVARYGFDASWEGVTQSHLSAKPWSNDPEVAGKFMLQKWLLDPEIQAQRPLPSPLWPAMRGLCEDIERPLKRRSQCAPLRSLQSSPRSAVGKQEVRLSWARPEQQVFVIPQVLKEDEVQASLGPSRIYHMIISCRILISD